MVRVSFEWWGLVLWSTILGLKNIHGCIGMTSSDRQNWDQFIVDFYDEYKERELMWKQKNQGFIHVTKIKEQTQQTFQK